MRLTRHGGTAAGPIARILLTASAFWALSSRPASAQGNVQVYIDSLWVANAAFCTGPISLAGSMGQFWCDGPPASTTPAQGVISNNPHIEFDQFPATCDAGALIPSGSTFTNVCNSRVFLCSRVGYSNT
ncbi:MAG: hypothetical protein HY551_01015, partial [Elusimicrobia bacterium]|nr:hypothetical protein [Elusimicrobiota bacterium]